MHVSGFARVPLLAVVLLALASCAERADENWPDEPWTVSDASRLGFDTTQLAALASRLASGEYRNIHSIVVLRAGHPVFEHYFYGDSATQHSVYSVTKSVTSAVLGAAMYAGDFPDVTTRIAQWLPIGDESDSSWRTVSVENLLTMRSGLEWTEDIEDGTMSSDFFDMQDTHDPMAFVMRKRFAIQPGTQFNYSGADFLLLSQVFTKETGQTLADYANRALFEPLDIESPDWTHLGQLTNTANGLLLRTRDMARIGHLYLREGRWKDRQILDPQWVRASLAKQCVLDPVNSYGYGWWTAVVQVGGASEALDPYVRRRLQVHAARGYAGQLIALVPELDVVVAITSNISNDDHECCDPLRIVTEGVIPAIVAPPLPPPA